MKTFIKVIAFDDEHKEADIVAELIHDTHVNDRVSYENFAILFRSNGQSRIG